MNKELIRLNNKLRKVNDRQIELYEGLYDATRARRIRINIMLDALAGEQRRLEKQIELLD